MSLDHNALDLDRSELFSLSYSRFTRRYWGNHCYFLFLRLVICLNSAGLLTSFEIRIKRLFPQVENLSYLLTTRLKIRATSQRKIGIRVNEHRCFLLAMHLQINRTGTERREQVWGNTTKWNPLSKQSRQAKLKASQIAANLTIADHLNVFELNWNWFSKKHAPRDSKERNLRSKVWWFTEFCNSHYVSHFAAFFIVARTKISIAKSCSS